MKTISIDDIKVEMKLVDTTTEISPEMYKKLCEIAQEKILKDIELKMSETLGVPDEYEKSTFISGWEDLK